MVQGVRRFCVTASVLLSFSASASALDHFLTIGGGYNPSGNQVSLEKNVLMFQQFLGEKYPDSIPHDIFFADGNAPGRDLQFADPNYHIPKVNQLLARLAREENALGYQYRSHQVPGVQGPSARETIERWFQEVGSKLPAEDRLFIYFTGHGGKTADPSNTVIHLWNQERISVREFTALLDRIPAKVPVVMVMVQCYSGGFANTIFNEGIAGKGPTGSSRCGFYATVQERTAAGCTPDIKEEDYKEYSSYFWAAIRGQTRAGVKLEAPDWDLDGRTSFAEAHAYALSVSDTIDISIKTSDALLRSISKNKGKEPAGLLTADSPHQALIAVANPVDRSLLDDLSSQLGIKAPHIAKEARKLAEQLQKQIKTVDDQRRKGVKPYEGLRRTILATCQVQWPELSNRWDPKVFELLQNEGDELAAVIEEHPKFSVFNQLHDELERLAEQKLDLERKWVKCQRLLRLVDNITLAANLPLVATPEAQTRFQALVKLENSSL